MEKEEKNFKLNFIGIGAGKSGSTWLYSNIIKHPEICNKNPKEIRFFDQHFDKGIEWYKKQFFNCEHSIKFKGEFSVQYMLKKDCASKIFSFFPDIKIIAILRNPIHRTYSAYLHSIRKGDSSSSLSFQEYINSKKNLEEAIYYEQLKFFYDYFSENNIKVLLLEEVEQDPLKSLKEIYEFIGVSRADFKPEGLKNKVNEAKSYKYLFLENIITRTSRTLHKYGYNLLVEKLKRMGVANIIRKMNLKGDVERKITSREENFLKEFFLTHNNKLSELIGNDLAVWN